MVEESIIKLNFSRMADTELIHLAESEGHTLTPASLLILQNEFAHRKLDMSVFGIVEDNRMYQKQKNIEEAQLKGEEKYLETAWLYAFDQKAAGKTDQEIKAGIIDKGLSENEAEEMLAAFESKAKEFLNMHETSIWTGSFICVGGFAVTLLTYAAAYAASGGVYIIAYGAILFGGIRIFKGLSNKKKFKTILSLIQSERT